MASNCIAQLTDYDAGLLNDWGGGNVDWWQDYVLAEIARANDFWRSQVEALAPAIRAAALEEAAKVADSFANGGCDCEGYGCTCGNYDDAGAAGGASTAKLIARRFCAMKGEKP